VRSETSLIQTSGRAARHEKGRVIFYADNLTLDPADDRVTYASPGKTARLTTPARNYPAWRSGPLSSLHLYDGSD